MIYFNDELRNYVYGLFYESLSYFGIFVLGFKELIYFIEFSDVYELLDWMEKIYWKIKQGVRVSYGV